MSDLRAWAQLVRLPNLPTAFADITLAALATGSLPHRWEVFAVLLVSSGSLYLSGMAWNDFFDVEEDRRERPGRPIPSGRISRRAAGIGATLLMLLGVSLAVLAGQLLTRQEPTASAWGPPLTALLLCGAILLYDSVLKHTPLGPLAMGGCRFLNVLLGASIAGPAAWPLGPYLALVVGLYIVGVTWFARSEAATSDPKALTGASLTMLASLLLAVATPVFRPEGTASPLFVYLLTAFGFWLGVPLWRAIHSPTSTHVQAGVKRALMGLILLDATLATGAAGTLGLVVLVLLAPSLYLNRRRWLYAT